MAFSGNQGKRGVSGNPDSINTGGSSDGFVGPDPPMATKLERPSFNLPAGFRLAGKYDVRDRLGGGWEGEVYLVRERGTGIERAVKLFYSKRNPGNRTARRYARKLHKLRNCSMVIQYHTDEKLELKQEPVTALVSEYVEGELLSDFLRRFPGNRLRPFEATHLLYRLACGLHEIHQQNEYHGDIHAENVIVRRFGLSFDLRFIDFFHWDAPRAENRQDDTLDLIRLYYDALGGRRYYSRQPPAVKYICAGLKRGLIRARFRTPGHLCRHLENLAW